MRGHPRHLLPDLPLIQSSDRKTAAKAGRQSVNSPTQSTLSDMGLWSIGIADREGLLDEGLEIFVFVHDAVLFYFPDTSRGWELVARMKWIMENLPYETLTDWVPELKMTVSGEVGPTKVVVQLLHQHPLAPDRVEHL